MFQNLTAVTDTGSVPCRLCDPGWHGPIGTLRGTLQAELRCGILSFLLPHDVPDMSCCVDSRQLLYSHAIVPAPGLDSVSEEGIRTPNL